jgi:hypothetical protein
MPGGEADEHRTEEDAEGRLAGPEVLDERLRQPDDEAGGAEAPEHAEHEAADDGCAPRRTATRRGWCAGRCLAGLLAARRRRDVEPPG